MHETVHSPPQATRPMFGGAALVTIVVALTAGTAGLWLTDGMVTVFHRMTQAPPPTDHINTDPRLSEDQRLMYSLTHVGGPTAVSAVRTMVARNDQRFVPVLIEMLASNEAQRGSPGAGVHEHVRALEQLTGERFRADARAGQRMADFWSQWYLSTDLRPPAGFIGWKGKLLADYNPTFARLLRDESFSTVRIEELRFAGRRRNRVHPLVDPRMIPAAQADFMEPDEPVFGVRYRGQARAYPQRIVDAHGVVNDWAGEMPICLARCTVTGAGRCYERRLGAGRIHTFRSSGLVYRGNELLCDRETDSLWCQYTGQPVVGELAGSGLDLTPIPVVVSTWSEWLSEHPETLVLLLPRERRDEYELGEAHGSYFASNELLFPLYRQNLALPAKSWVYGLADDDDRNAKAYPLELLASQKVVNDTVGDTPVVLVATNGTVRVQRRFQFVEPRRGRPVPFVETRNIGYLAGGEVRAYLRGGESFRPAADAEAVLDAQNQRWEITEEALVGPSGRTVPRLVGVESFWFGWLAFHPETEIYRAP